MNPVKVFIQWLYLSKTCKVGSFLSLTSKCLNRELYDYTNRIFPEIAKLRKYKAASKGWGSVEYFKYTQLGLHCSLRMAAFLLVWDPTKAYVTDSVNCVRNFIENPNLGTWHVSTNPETIVTYFLRYRARFKDDPLFVASFNELNTETLKCMWKNIPTKRTLKYCLNNFPQHTKQIVDGVMESESFEPEFLQAIDEYKDKLYSTLQKKKALTWVSRKRSLDRDYVEVNDDVDVKQIVNNMNETTAFLLRRKKNKSY